ncbi:sensor histidine kinase [Malonomonas rubra]|uniref:ATP-binding protein n=1 Tax=Malonomonas rubra TaxID=57040 RepID=UPI0026ED1062|nr:sensor histidine kinase [Malonomonas rubra]
MPFAAIRRKPHIIHSSLKTRMILLVCLLVLSLTLVAGAMYTAMIGEILEEKIGKQALQVAQTVAKIPLVRRQIIKLHPEGELQRLAEEIRQQTGAEFIVIGNIEGVRFSHPNPDRIGQKMVGGDNAPALERGESYVSRAVGTLGPSIRGKAPIISKDDGIIGVVSVGYLLEDVHHIVQEQQLKVGVLVGILMLIGVFGAVHISNHVKQQIFGLEPEQIAWLFNERATIIESIREGIVAIDRDACVTVANRVAIESVGCKTEDELLGKHIREVLPGAHLRKVLDGGAQRFDNEFEVSGTMMILNTVPMIENGKIVGAVASFRRKDELDIIAKQLSQVKEYSEMLRAQTHEYSNKLHTIAGLIQIGHEKEALDLIGKETAGYQGLIAFLAKAVPFPVLAAFLIGKYNHAQELHINFIIDPESQLTTVPDELSREKLVTILGNLIDNAFDAALHGKNPPRVTLSMTDSGNDLVFEVGDSGAGIPPELVKKIFDRGFTTKQQDRGHGLYLVMTALQDFGGEITLGDSELGGALFTAFIPKRKNG